MTKYILLILFCSFLFILQEGKTGRTLLHFAIEENNEKLVNFLFDECPQISLETETYSGLTAYQLASLTHNQLLIEDLKRRGAEPISPPDSEIDDDESDMEDYQVCVIILAQ